MELVLSDILKGMPGITPVEGADLEENCVAMLHRSHHVSPTKLHLYGLSNDSPNIVWTDRFDEQMNRTY